MGMVEESLGCQGYGGMELAVVHAIRYFNFFPFFSVINISRGRRRRVFEFFLLITSIHLSKTNIYNNP